MRVLAAAEHASGNLDVNDPLLRRLHADLVDLQDRLRSELAEADASG